MTGEPGGAAERLRRDVTAVVQEDLGQAKAEVLATIRRAGLASAALAASGVCATLALASAHQALLRTVERFLPRHHAACALTATYATAAATLACYARSHARAAGHSSREALDALAEE
ncbi:hypothetical protein GCM10010218_61170 [Streptomyces mashuensis]|uniref:Uncharacterized protein n=1 Tax=Streptomyces mashuensis TaxID=33904 RepID=A0A919B8P5_9ACTN|nr:phage holin family protein [Streptomyces mashuensis]GHF71712.1 hypothetical protein GCM10010218_61170 [Streptomyces mashuensis]